MSRLSASVAVVALLAQGCAIVTTHGAPSTLTPQHPPDCTTSKAAVYVDGAIAGAAVGTAVLLGIVALAKQAALDDGETNDYAYATLYTFLGGVGFSISGVVGGLKVRSCRRATADWRRQFSAPLPYTPQPYPPQPYPSLPAGAPPGATAPR
jgi:hypothetical protein